MTDIVFRTFVMYCAIARPAWVEERSIHTSTGEGTHVFGTLSRIWIAGYMYTCKYVYRSIHQIVWNWNGFWRDCTEIDCDVIVQGPEIVHQDPPQLIVLQLSDWKGTLYTPKSLTSITRGWQARFLFTGYSAAKGRGWARVNKTRMCCQPREGWS